MGRWTFNSFGHSIRHNILPNHSRVGCRLVAYILATYMDNYQDKYRLVTVRLSSDKYQLCTSLV